MIKEKAGDPEASVSMHNLERIDASREWLGVVLRIPEFGRAPHLDKIAKLLNSGGDAALEELLVGRVDLPGDPVCGERRGARAAGLVVRPLLTWP
jgi:hypothetical protein